MAYLNEHHKSDVLLPFVRAFSELGTTSIQKNMWMGGSYSIIDAEVTDVTPDEIRIVATVREGQRMTNESVAISLDGDPVSGMAKTFPTLPQIDPLILNNASMTPIDSFCRRMIRLCNIVKAYDATGKMIQLGVQLGGKGVGKLVRALSMCDARFIRSDLVGLLKFNISSFAFVCASCLGMV